MTTIRDSVMHVSSGISPEFFPLPDCVEGDLLVAFIGASGEGYVNGTLSPGWTDSSYLTGDVAGGQMWRKTATAANVGGSLAVTFTDTNVAHVAIVSIPATSHVRSVRHSHSRAGATGVPLAAQTYSANIAESVVGDLCLTFAFARTSGAAPTLTGGATVRETASGAGASSALYTQEVTATGANSRTIGMPDRDGHYYATFTVYHPYPGPWISDPVYVKANAFQSANFAAPVDGNMRGQIVFDGHVEDVAWVNQTIVDAAFGGSGNASGAPTTGAPLKTSIDYQLLPTKSVYSAVHARGPYVYRAANIAHTPLVPPPTGATDIEHEGGSAEGEILGVVLDFSYTNYDEDNTVNSAGRVDGEWATLYSAATGVSIDSADQVTAWDQTTGVPLALIPKADIDGETGTLDLNVSSILFSKVGDTQAKFFALSMKVTRPEGDGDPFINTLENLSADQRGIGIGATHTPGYAHATLDPHRYRYLFRYPQDLGDATLTWWDGDSRETCDVVGWWDGTELQPVTLQGWWDGTSIQPVVAGTS